MKIEYMVVEGVESAELEKLVDGYLKDGWRLSGGVSAIQYEGHDGISVHLFQAMTLTTLDYPTQEFPR